MTSGSDSLDVATMECRQCHHEVPAGGYCGRCGAHLTEEPGDGPQWLRPRTFGAAPKERVLVPHVSSSIFPHLPDRSRKAFRIAMALGVVLLTAFALLRMPAAGISVAALGLPLMFLLYLRASKLDLDISRATLVATALLGAVLGVSWVMVGGALVAHSYGVPMGVGLALHHVLQAGLAIPTAGMLLMVVPAVVMRLRHRQDWESLDGFVIGALGALMFTAAATIARLGPQFSAGLVVHQRPVQGLVVQAALCGVTVPVTAAAAGGLVGVWLWFRPRTDDVQPRRVKLVLGLLALAALLAHVAVGAVDIIGLPQLWMLSIHTLLTIGVLLAQRAALHLALLHEVQDPIREDEPILCVHCEMVVPDMPFCPACGVAAHASSKASRRARRGDACPIPSVSDQTRTEALVEYPGYALPTGTYVAPRLRPTRSTWLLSRWGVVITTATVLMGALALWLTPKIPHYTCPPDCGRPPTGTPVSALPRFAAPGGGFSVAYPAPGSAYTIDTQNAGVTATLTVGDGGVMQLFSEPANGRTAKEITKAAIRKAYPDAKFAYQIPNAMVGYQPGYGEVADDWPQSSSSTSNRVRILVMTSVKNDVALIAFATGPYHAFGPDFGPGPPSGANLQIAQDMGKYVNSFQWTGDPPR